MKPILAFGAAILCATGLCATGLCAGALYAASGLAGEPPTTQPLAGPTIRDDHPSIVERDMTGNLRPVEFTPERVAVAKLVLDEATRRRVDHIIIAHRELLDRLVADHIDLVLRARGAGDGTPVVEKAWIIAAALQAFRPALEGPSLWEQISPVLGAVERDRFDAMMREYWDAVFHQATGGREPTTLEKTIISARHRLAVLGEEIRLAVDGLGNSGPLVVRAMTSGLVLSSSQNDRLAEIARDFDTATLHQPSGDDHKRLLLQVCAVLDEDQRRVVLARVPR